MADSTATYPPGYLDEYCGGRLVAATTVMLVSSIILLGLRLYARALTPAERGWDEYLLFPSWLALVGLCVTCYLSIPVAGAGYHLPKVKEKASNSGIIVFVLDWFYLTTATLSRLSVVVLFLRIFVRRSTRICCWVIFTLLVGFWIAGVVVNMVQCVPVSYGWNKQQPGSCIDQVLWYKVINYPNIVMDSAILLLPIETVYKLNTTKARKIGIAFIFLTGSMGLVASTIRTTRFYIDFGEDVSDNTLVLADLLAWTIAEAGMYFCSACLVNLRPLFVRLSHWLSPKTSPSARRRSRRNPYFTAGGYHAEAIALSRRDKKTRPREFGPDTELFGSETSHDALFSGTNRTRLASEGLGARMGMNEMVNTGLRGAATKNRGKGDSWSEGRGIMVRKTVDVESTPAQENNGLALPIQVPGPLWRSAEGGGQA